MDPVKEEDTETYRDNLRNEMLGMGNFNEASSIQTPMLPKHQQVDSLEE